MNEQYDFSSQAVADRVGGKNQWQRLKESINWGLFSSILKATDQTGYDGGRPPYDPNKMFRVILLGQWHDLSDEELEYSLRVRLDFLMFCGFTLSDRVPDRATINLFRNKLVQEELLPKCLEVLNKELERLKIKITSNKLVLDSTIVESAARPRNVIEAGKDDQDPPSKTTSLDPDAKWTVKGKNYHYGYKEHALVSQEQGFVEKIDVTPANIHDGTMLESMLESVQGIEALLADKAYASKANRDYLSSKQIKDKILRKGQRNKELSAADKIHNAKISARRFIVEQYFGTKKRKFNFYRARYFGLARVTGQAFLKAICFNLLKAKNILSPPTRRFA